MLNTNKRVAETEKVAEALENLYDAQAGWGLFYLKIRRAVVSHAILGLEEWLERRGEEAARLDRQSCCKHIYGTCKSYAGSPHVCSITEAYMLTHRVCKEVIIYNYCPRCGVATDKFNLMEVIGQNNEHFDDLKTAFDEFIGGKKCP